MQPFLRLIYCKCISLSLAFIRWLISFLRTTCMTHDLFELVPYFLSMILQTTVWRVPWRSSTGLPNPGFGCVHQSLHKLCSLRVNSKFHWNNIDSKIINIPGSQKINSRKIFETIPLNAGLPLPPAQVCPTFLPGPPWAPTTSHSIKPSQLRRTLWYLTTRRLRIRNLASLVKMENKIYIIIRTCV